MRETTGMSIETENPNKTAYIDVEAMLAACVPGGSIADPQAIADAIRAWVAEQPAAQEANCPEIPDSSVSSAEPAAQEAVGYTQMTVGGWAVATLYYQALNLPAGTKLYTRPAEPAAVLEPPRKELVIEAWPTQQAGMHVGMPNGVKIMHVPSRIVAACDSERSQHRNRDLAMHGIRAMLAAREGQ